MAKLPTRDDLGGLPSARSGRTIANYDVSAIGRGKVALGESIAQAGQSIGAGLATISERGTTVDQATRFETQRRHMEFQASQEEALKQFEQAATPGAFGFREGFQQSYKKAADAFFDTIPDALKPEYDARLFKGMDDISGKALTFERAQRKTYYETSVNDGLTTIENKLYANPSDFDANLKEGIDYINSIPDEDVSRIEKEDMGRQWRKKAQGASLAGLPPKARTEAVGGTVRGSDAVNSVVDRIIGVESGGNASAKNPRSSASGLGQFTNSTWVATVRKHRPDITGSNDDLLALKTDPALGREMTLRHTQDNARELGSAGFDITPGNLYLAHFAGVGGAKKVLNAQPSDSVASVLGNDVISANPFLVGKDVAWLRDWTAKKMGSGEVAPQYADMTWEEREKVVAGAASEMRNEAVAAAAQEKAALIATKDALDLGIVNGSVVSELEIMEAPIDDGDKATLIRSLRTRDKAVMQLHKDLLDLQNGALRLDPYASDDKNRADNLYNETLKQAGVENAVAVAGAVLEQTGVVPQPVINTMRRGLAGTNVEEFVSAAQTAQRVSALNPAALGRRDGGGEVQKAADDFSFYVNTLNLSPEEAARRMIERNKPEKQFERKALEPAAKEFMKTLQGEDLASQFDESWFGWRSNAEIGFSPAQELGIKAEYLAIAEDQFYAVNGDPELAKNRATEEMKRLYGVTELTGKKVLMKHPPERYWPQFKIAEAAQSLSYPVQLQDDIRALDATADMDSVQLVTTPETDHMVKRGEAPGYAVLYKDANGVLQTIPGKLWLPDFTKLRDMQQKVDDVEQRNRLERAQGAQVQERQQAPYRVQKQDDFLTGDDPVFGDRDGPELP